MFLRRLPKSRNPTIIRTFSHSQLAHAEGCYTNCVFNPASLVSPSIFWVPYFLASSFMNRFSPTAQILEYVFIQVIVDKSLATPGVSGKLQWMTLLNAVNAFTGFLTHCLGIGTPFTFAVIQKKEPKSMIHRKKISMDQWKMLRGQTVLFINFIYPDVVHFLLASITGGLPPGLPEYLQHGHNSFECFPQIKSNPRS